MTFLLSVAESDDVLLEFVRARPADASPEKPPMETLLQRQRLVLVSVQLLKRNLTLQLLHLTLRMPTWP